MVFEITYIFYSHSKHSSIHSLNFVFIFIFITYNRSNLSFGVGFLWENVVRKILFYELCIMLYTLIYRWLLTVDSVTFLRKVHFFLRKIMDSKFSFIEKKLKFQKKNLSIYVKLYIYTTFKQFLNWSLYPCNKFNKRSIP